MDSEKTILPEDLEDGEKWEKEKMDIAKALLEIVLSNSDKEGKDE